MADRVVIQAPCKLNLTLDITGDGGDGYHLLDTVMLTASLSDVVIISSREEPGISITSNWDSIPLDESNLAVVAARRFFAATGCPERGLSIHLDKRIPIEAGLAGGSADGAAVLTGLNFLCDTALDPTKMKALGLEVGSDVPFCLLGRCVRAGGRGERLESVSAPAGMGALFVIAKPPERMSTRLAYQQYDEWRGELCHPSGDAMVQALETGDLSAVGAAMGNVFSQVCSLPETVALCQKMKEAGALGAVMTGSGTAVAGLFGEEEKARACIQRLEGQAELFLTRPLSHGSRILFSDG